MLRHTPRCLLFIVNDLKFFVSHRLALAEAAVREGYEVHIASPQMATEVPGLLQKNFCVHQVRISTAHFNPWGEIASFVRIVCLIHAIRPEVVHSVTVKPNIYGGIAARLLRVPSIVLAISGLGHVFLATNWRAALQRFFVMGFYRHALRHPHAKVIFQNDQDAAFFVQNRLVSQAQIVMIRGSGVDTNVFQPVPEPQGDPVIAFPARILREKGVYDFIEAVQILRRTGVLFRAVVVGSVDAKNPSSVSEKEIHSWVSRNQVEWWGFSHDMPAVYSACHIVCLPSYREGLPKTLLEAGACGRPSVTTDVPGCRDVIRDGTNGLLVPAKSPRHLAQALETLIQNSDLRRQMGENARQTVLAHYRVETVVAQTLALYREISSAGDKL